MHTTMEQNNSLSWKIGQYVRYGFDMVDIGGVYVTLFTLCDNWHKPYEHIYPLPADTFIGTWPNKNVVHVVLRVKLLYDDLYYNLGTTWIDPEYIFYCFEVMFVFEIVWKWFYHLN